LKLTTLLWATFFRPGGEVFDLFDTADTGIGSSFLDEIHRNSMICTPSHGLVTKSEFYPERTL